MAGTSTRRYRRQKFIFTAPAFGGGTWSAPIQVTRLGRAGLLSRAVLRAPAASALTGAEVKVFFGPGYSIATDPDTVPDEDTAYHETAIVVVGSATTADLDKNLKVELEGGGYDIRDDKSETMWVAIKTTAGGPQANVVVSLEAYDTF